MPPLSSTARRAAIVVASTVALGLASAPALAAPVTGSAPGKASAVGVPVEQRLKDVRTSVDPDTGAWSTTVAFRVPQDDAVGWQLGVDLRMAGEPAAMTTWGASTGTAGLDLRYHRFGRPGATPPGIPGSAPLPGSAATFNADRTALTLTVVDSRLVGRTPLTVGAWLREPESGDQRSQAVVPLGPKAPKAAIPAAVRRLTVPSSRRLRIPLSRLPVAADRRITVEAPNGNVLIFRTLPAKYWRRTAVDVRVTPRAFRQLSRHWRRATFEVRTTIENTSTTSATRAIRIRAGR